jgi:glycosyltransferase involved in cell wall biosynthesis
MVKNEADIVEAFVRHHGALFDHLVVIDHASTDATATILESLRAEGLPLTVVPDPALAFQQAEHLTMALHDALPRHGADYAFVLDADEFVRVASREALDAAFAGVDGNPALSIPWALYVGPREDSNEPHPLRRIRLRAECGRQSLSKVVVARQFAERGWCLAPGSHWVLARSDGGYDSVPLVPLPGVELAHLPFRSPEQFLSKIVLGWFGNRLLQGEQARSSPINWHWRELFYAWLGGRTPDWSELQRYALEWYLLRPTPDLEQIAMERVTLRDDPLPAPFELRYTPGDAADPLRRLAAWTDTMLDRISPAP